MEPTYQDIKRACLKLGRIRETLQSLPQDDDDVRETLEECEGALESANPSEIRSYAADGMFRAVPVDDEYDTSLRSDFHTVLNLLPEGIDHERVDRIWKQSGKVMTGDISDLEDFLIDELEDEPE